MRNKDRSIIPNKGNKVFVAGNTPIIGLVAKSKNTSANLFRSDGQQHVSNDYQAELLQIWRKKLLDRISEVLMA